MLYIISSVIKFNKPLMTNCNITFLKKALCPENTNYFKIHNIIRVQHGNVYVTEKFSKLESFVIIRKIFTAETPNLNRYMHCIIYFTSSSIHI